MLLLSLMEKINLDKLIKYTQKIFLPETIGF